MSAMSDLSVELWQTILRYAIGIAGFLDPDAFEGMVGRYLSTDAFSPIHDEAAYWHAEKTRNTLQLVSKSWDAYLRPYKNRFVRMSDVQDQKVGLDVLKGAVRVSFGRYENDYPEDCDAPRTFETFCLKTIANVGEMDMQIADMRREEYTISDIIRVISNFRHVRTLIASGCTYNNDLPLLLGGLPKIRHLYGKGYRGALRNCEQATFSSSTLVTLSFHIKNSGRYETVAWDLPSLRHLRLKNKASGESMDSVKDIVVIILRAVGRRLLSLGLYLRCHGSKPMGEIWELCPHLEIFQGDVSMKSSPPFFHPLHTLVIPNPRALEGLKSLPEWANLRKIIVYRSSGDIREGRWLTSVRSRPEIRVEDKNGVSIDEFINGPREGSDDSAKAGAHV